MAGALDLVSDGGDTGLRPGPEPDGSPARCACTRQGAEGRAPTPQCPSPAHGRPVPASWACGGGRGAGGDSQTRAATCLPRGEEEEGGEAPAP